MHTLVCSVGRVNASWGRLRAKRHLEHSLGLTQAGTELQISGRKREPTSGDRKYLVWFIGASAGESPQSKVLTLTLESMC